ncbi:NAD(P)/FAD-dependent oxidoreductase [Streptomyces eurocidicus]|uniref:Flavin-dependent dehydrogenase n=1 Tax=Streptomyces eurocidicus TaxID=66423 RepID=A0A7W8BHC1_STREU|nr:FAD-dependent oxidoreductase [Streptomyces eurocidicus]MBB5122937.1 flavin-dependent dehydrogenase [Streptomyces eurocidicus]MBF6055021.1 FAD-dependent oxidoreductase [Streptomyces eurocidicus]
MTTPRTIPPRPAGDRTDAVVVGAGIAGLLAAHVLARRHQVTLLDGDRIPGTPDRRSGVPQDGHVHALFAQGLRTVEALLPGFTAELCRRGGLRIDVCADLAIATPHGWGTRFPSNLRVVGASRPLIEAVIREHVLDNPRVRLLERHRVHSLTGDERHVSAVVVHDLDTGQGTAVPAALVVDASGRGSRLPNWLTGLGCPPVPETTVDAHIGYATRLYRLPAGPRGWRALYALPSGPAVTRGGVLAPVEDDRWIVSLSGAGTDRPPSHEDAFLPFARTLATPAIADALAGGTPLSGVVRSHSTANRRRHLDRARHFPGNLLVLGDAACAFNPVYAQGMTVAARSARLLRSCLASGASTRRFHHRQKHLHDTPWLLATTADLRFPHTTGGPPSPHQRALGRYLDRVLAAGTHDARAQAAFLNVLNMVHPPVTLLAPRVALSALRTRASGPSLTAPPPDPEPSTNCQGAPHVH